MKQTSYTTGISGGQSTLVKQQAKANINTQTQLTGKSAELSMQKRRTTAFHFIARGAAKRDSIFLNYLYYNVSIKYFHKTDKV